MFPLVLTLTLAFLSFISSAFVVLRTIIPILPPHPLSSRVRPSEFGLPNYKSLAPADKAHLWLIACDFTALVVFVWQVVTEGLVGPHDLAIQDDPLAAVRFWLANTIRITSFCIVIGITLLHVRLGLPVVFGVSHWLIWVPILLLMITSTALSGVLAGVELPSLFIGVATYSTSLTVFSSIAFALLIASLLIIRRNLTAVNEEDDSWPPLKQSADRPRPSFAADDIEALKDGSSWITSNASSRAESISAFSFSTHANHSAKPSNGSVHMVSGSIPPKSSFWFNPTAPSPSTESPVPPVPRLPSPYRPSSPTSASVCDDPDPFRRWVGNDPRVRMGSQSSWLTEPSVAQTSLAAWSFPPSSPETPADYYFSTVDLNSELLPAHAVSRPATPAIANAQVLGGYGYSAEYAFNNKGVAGLSAIPDGDLDLPVLRILVWLIYLWVPLTFSLPYVLSLALSRTSSTITSVFLVLSITLPAPLLALNIILKYPLPIPASLFTPLARQTEIPRSSSVTLTHPWSNEYKRSGSVTVIEGRRSGDVWLTNGDAVDGNKKIGRALEMLNAKPKLSVLPLENGDVHLDGELTPPLPMQDEPLSIPPTPQSENSAEVGRKRKESKASSYYSGADAYTTRIMVAQRHYSALATTVVVPPSPLEKKELLDSPSSDSVMGIATGSDARGPETPNAHLRSRSLSYVPRSAISPPPSSPLPPTPPSVKASRAALGHKRSQSSGFSFGAVLSGDLNEIDALSAGVLPLLVPGLKIGKDIKVRDDWRFSPSTLGSKSSKAKKRTRHVDKLSAELGGLSGEFSSPEVHSTPAAVQKPGGRTKKTSNHKRHHFSLPSLGLGKDDLHKLSWRNNLDQALNEKISDDGLVVSDERRNTVAGELPDLDLPAVREDDEVTRPLSPATTTSTQLRPPSSMMDATETARSSLATLINVLDNELKTPLATGSEATMFNFDDDSGPQAQSTPHDSNKPFSDEPTLPLLQTSRRSSIMYIKSDENTRPTHETTISPNRFAQLSSRVVKPLVPKPNKPKGMLSSMHNNENVMSSPGGRLRPLSLLQERDTNRSAAVAVVDADNSNVRPLVLGKKQKVVTDENAVQPPTNSTKNLKPLKLARSDTTKMRAILRRREVLPEVVVRPPSDYVGFAR